MNKVGPKIVLSKLSIFGRTDHTSLLLFQFDVKLRPFVRCVRRGGIIWSERTAGKNLRKSLLLGMDPWWHRRLRRGGEVCFNLVRTQPLLGKKSSKAVSNVNKICWWASPEGPDLFVCTGFFPARALGKPWNRGLRNTQFLWNRLFLITVNARLVTLEWFLYDY
jgi:hypothetical protein